MNPINYKSRPWLMLFLRLILFFCIQAAVAIGLYLGGNGLPWITAANWWPFFVTFTNLICVYLLVYLHKGDGKSYWNIFKIEMTNLKKDLLTVLGVVIIVGPVSYFPNIILARFLFGDPQATLDLLVRPLPYWAAVTGMIVFPLTQGLAELATYFSYVMPRFEKAGFHKWSALVISACGLSLQHIAIPFLFDVRYIAWRGLMFLPFALLVGLVIQWRPRLLPYLAVVHILMDIAFAGMLLSVAY